MLTTKGDRMETIQDKPVITMEDAADLFHTMLDECFEPAKYNSYEWPMSRVLPAMDYIMYREKFNNFLESLTGMYHIKDLY